MSLSLKMRSLPGLFWAEINIHFGKDNKSQQAVSLNEWRDPIETLNFLSTWHNLWDFAKVQMASRYLGIQYYLQRSRKVVKYHLGGVLSQAGYNLEDVLCLSMVFQMCMNVRMPRVII